MSSKILLVRKFREETRVRSVVVGETGFYWRSFPSVEEVKSALQKEDFALLIFDHRGVSGDPLVFIESLRDGQKNVPAFLFSEPLELETVIRAIRVGVKDMFHPPLNLPAIIERVQAVLNPGAEAAPETHLEKWSEFVLFLAEEGSPAADGAAAGKGRAKKAAGTVDAAQLTFLAAERDRLAEELKALRGRAAKNEKECARLESELVQLSADRKKKEKVAARETEERTSSNQELAGEREKFEMEQQVLAQARKKFDALRAETEAGEARAAAALARREKELAEHEQELLLKQQAQADAAKRLAAEQAKLEQSGAGQGTAQKAELPPRLAADQARHESAQAALQQAQAKLEAERTEFEKMRTKLQKQQRDLAESEAELQEIEAKTRAESAQLKKAQAQLAKDRSVLAAEKAALEQETAR